jgi:hypothetical protein
MKLNTIIQLPDGRIGTICYNNLDGAGGIWGEHEFAMPEGGFGDNLPRPAFLLREVDYKSLYPNCESVGKDYEILEQALSGDK